MFTYACFTCTADPIYELKYCILFDIYNLFANSQIKKLIEENTKELDELVNELNLAECREEFGNWAAEITACGKRM